MRRGTSSLGTDVPSEREINRLAARTDEEFWMFEKMDEERRQKENYRSRLMEEHEVPEWAYSAPDNMENNSKRFDGSVTGKRRRRDVVYADSLTDRQWMMAVENGEDLSRLSGRGRRRNQLPSESNIDEAEQTVTELNENTPVLSEGTSEDTYGLTTPTATPTPAPKRHKSEGDTSERNDVNGCNGPLVTWNHHRKKRSSVQSSSSDSRGQNSNGRVDGSKRALKS